jgi:hypothetical protein
MSVSEEIHNCCPFCGGQGFTVFSNNGEPEQEQCQFCYDVAYPLAEKVAKLEREWISIKDDPPELYTWIVARHGNKRPFTCRLVVLHNSIYQGEAYIDADNLIRAPTQWAHIPPTKREIE